MNITVVTKPNQDLYGLWIGSDDKSVARDIPALSERYHSTVGKAPDSVLPFFVVSKDYDTESGQFRLFVGGTIRSEGLESFSLPEGLYAQVTVRPKLGFLWGPAIGAAKRYVYTRWIPASEYSTLNLEYEYHTEKSLGGKPEIDLLFAVKGKL